MFPLTLKSGERVIVPASAVSYFAESPKGQNGEPTTLLIYTLDGKVLETTTSFEQFVSTHFCTPTSIIGA